jgi:predicted ATPase
MAMTTASAPFLRSIQLDGLLSFAPGSPTIPLTALNVLIGPNASGKSNLIEAFELLRATRDDLAAAIPIPAEWLWKGQRRASGSPAAKLIAIITRPEGVPDLSYRLEFTETAQRLKILDEALEESTPRQAGDDDVYFYYRFRRGVPAIRKRIARTGAQPRSPDAPSLVPRASFDPAQSVFSQRRDPDVYPEVTRVGEAFGRVLIFREWSFGRSALLHQSHRADLASDILLPNLRNLGLVLNSIEHGDRWSELNTYLRRFLPRFERLTTRILGGHVQIYLHEAGLGTPVPATRLSDGTLRFIGLLAILPCERHAAQSRQRHWLGSRRQRRPPSSHGPEHGDVDRRGRRRLDGLLRTRLLAQRTAQGS